MLKCVLRLRVLHLDVFTNLPQTRDCLVLFGLRVRIGLSSRVLSCSPFGSTMPAASVPEMANRISHLKKTLAACVVSGRTSEDRH